MNTFDAIYQRRAIKAFDPEHRLTSDEEKKLLEAAIQAPTSFNIQHWRFVILRDPELRRRIRTEFGNDQAQMTDASLLILMTGDVKAWEKQPERYWRNAPKEVAELVGLPDDHVLGPMLAIGKGTKESWPKPGQLSLDEIVFQDHF